MSEQRTTDPKMPLWRVSIGMQQRTIRAEDPFSACHACGLGSGDLMRATVEVIEGTTEYPTGMEARFSG